MIRNYFLVALRNLQKNRLYAFVNIFGLAVGICCCLLIGIYILHELSFDRFHKNADRLARVTWAYNFGDVETRTASTGTRVGPEFRRSFPEVKEYVRTLKFPRVIRHEDKMFEEESFLYADAAFFSVFSFPLLAGDPQKVLDGPEKMVITESTARKYFGNENPVGKSVQVGDNKTFEITGVAADAPANSQIRFDFVGSFSTLNAAKTEKWNEANYITYLLLHDKDARKPLQQKIDNYMNTVAKAELGLQGNNYSRYQLEPLTDVHLRSDLQGLEPNNNIVYIYMLAAVALLILLIGCVNYTNLSTAQAARRSAEIGMRKVFGAVQPQIFRQFIWESVVLVLLGAVTAIVLAALLLPYFNQLSGKELDRSVLLSPETLGLLALLILLVAFAAGAYPAMILSKGRVIQILKKGFRFTGSGGLRKSLITVQFIISIFLIVATIVILQQLSYINNKELGYDKEQVVVLPLDKTLLDSYDALKAAMAAHPQVSGVAAAYESPVDIGWSDGLHKGSGEEAPPISVNALPVDEDFVKTLGLKIMAGADYSRADLLQMDTSNEGRNLKYTYMLNESAARALGWTPEQAIGKTVAKGREGIVKAVVKDFHFRSLHEAITPLVIFLDKRMVGSMFVKISGADVQRTLGQLQNIWKQRVSHRPFEYHFLDEDYQALYKTEQRTAGVFTTFSVLAILLACLGLFALTAYSMVQRTKEIGIRKILGASLLHILGLMSKDFVRLLLVALLIAIPLAWMAMQQWLDKFTYRISLQWWVFTSSGLLALAIAFCTIFLQVLRTSHANPVKSLRTE